jgi:CheY-like chemotaxis protein
METVLIVDDSAVDRRLAGGVLAKLPQLRIEYASDGSEALDRLAEIAPDLIVSDLVMPGRNGLELVEEVARLRPHLPVVLMTNKGSEEIAVKALKAGAASYVPKSQLAKMLPEIVLHVLSLARQRRSQANLMASIVRSEMVFDLGIDDTLIAPLVHYLQNCLSGMRMCDESASLRVCIALEEALRNAMFHGNLEISSAEREGDCDTYCGIVQQRRESLPFRDRHLFVRVLLDVNEARFTIRDEGPGFNPALLPDPTDPENLDKVSGRGLLLMRTFMDDVTYNEVGNEVTMVKRVSTPSPAPADA